MPDSSTKLHIDRSIVFISHAAPEENEFALWLSSKLALAGYRVWIDRRRLKGGTDTWNEIDHILRNETIKQIVLYGAHMDKRGVKRELGIGDAVARLLDDEQFFIPIRVADVSFSSAPPEFVRTNILNAYPNWHDCLEELFETLRDSGVPKSPTPQTSDIEKIIDARQEGRKFISSTPEDLLTNWFPLNAPDKIRYFRMEGTEDQKRIWCEDCKLPHVRMGLLVGMFATQEEAEESSSFNLTLTLQYEVPFEDFISGANLGPYLDRKDARNNVVNLFRQSFELLARRKGLKPMEFASGEIGWYFPDGLVSGGAVKCVAPDGRKIRRSMSGKFLALRWHTCIIPKFRLGPVPILRLHMNVVISENGQNALSGDETYKKRARLTKSWWNGIWRDRLLAVAFFLADENLIQLGTDVSIYSANIFPIIAPVSVSYEDLEAPPPSEENEDGNINLISTLGMDISIFDNGEEAA